MKKIKEQEERRFQKKVGSGLRKCPGHWINKKMGLRNKDCIVEGKCVKCGGYEKK